MRLVEVDHAENDAAIDHAEIDAATAAAIDRCMEIDAENDHTEIDAAMEVTMTINEMAAAAALVFAHNRFE